MSTILASAPTGMAGPVALFIIVLLCIASYFLFRSMSRHLKRVPLDFPTDPEFPELHTTPGHEARDGEPTP
jgi:hypothetical protein